MSFPTGIPSYATSNNSMTLSEFGHLTRHKSMEADIVALATKLGISSSTPTVYNVLRSDGAGSSVWGKVVLTTDITGTLPVANGGTGTTTLTFPTGTDTLVGRATTDTLTNKTLTSPVLTTPSLGTPASGDLSNTTNIGNANLLTTAGDIGGAWKSYTPSLTNGTIGSGTATGAYTQIGKTIQFWAKLVFAANTSITTGFRFSLPTTATVFGNNILRGVATAIDDSDGSKNYSGHVIISENTLCRPTFNNASATYAVSTVVSATVPIIFGTSDTLAVFGTYQA